MKIPGLAMVIPGSMFSSMIEMPGLDIAPDQTRQGNEAVTNQQFDIVLREPEVITALVCQGRHLDAMELQGRTTLMWAAENGEAAIVKKLLKAGAGVNATDWWGRTALSLALENGHRKVVALLVEHGANVIAG